MKTSRYAIILTSMLALLSACGESLEDTYKEWAGDGEIRYLGKCSNLMVAPGWQRIIVTWENSIDPAIKQIKVGWMLDGVRDSVMLERGTTEYSIGQLKGQPLQDGNYEVSVSAVGDDGKSSIANTTAARPYTYNHEEILTFNQMVSRVYVLSDRLILFFYPWQDNIKEASLNYTKANGSSGKLELNKEFYARMQTENNGLYWLLEDAITPSGAIVLNRRAELPSCNDVIEFEPRILDANKMYDSDFTQVVESQYGYSEIPDSWANSVETVCLDMSIGSFGNLLNLPNLKKLILGSRRYLLPASANDVVYGQCAVSDKAASDFVLKILNTLNGLEVERYNKHFQTLAAAAYIHDKGAPTMPDVDFIDMTGMQFTQQPASDTDPYLSNLTDGNYSSNWVPEGLADFSPYELTLDMKSPKTIHGLCLVQMDVSNTIAQLAYAPEYAAIKVSTDGVNWKSATYTVDSRLGKSNGEINYVNFSSDVQAGAYRYLRVQITPIFYSRYYRSSIAELRPY